MHAWASRAEREASMSRFWPTNVPGGPGCWLSLRIRQGRANRAFVSGVSGVPVIEDKKRKEERENREGETAGISWRSAADTGTSETNAATKRVSR
jgi:hypothetical protein